MDEINEEESSSTVTSFEDCGMSSTSDEMCDLALKFLVNLRSGKDEMMQINGLEALCQITRDVLSDGNPSEERNNFNMCILDLDHHACMHAMQGYFHEALHA